MKLQIKTLAQHVPMIFQDHKQFIEFCNQVCIKDREKLVMFYIHNLTLNDMNIWDPNAKLGDTQLMTLES